MKQLGGGHKQLIPPNYFSLLQEAFEFSGLKNNCDVKRLTIKDIAEYSKERIQANLLNKENFVSVDNLLKNKLGKVDSVYLQTKGSCAKFFKEDILIGNIRPYLKKI